MAEPQGVAELMEGHAEQIGVSADMPGFRFVEMQIASDRLGIGGRGIKGMGEDRGGGEGKAVSMVAAGEENVYGLRSGCVGALLPGDLNDVGPLRHGRLDGRLGVAGGELAGHLAKDVADGGGVVVGSSPAGTIGWDQLSG